MSLSATRKPRVVTAITSGPRPTALPPGNQDERQRGRDGDPRSGLRAEQARLPGHASAQWPKRGPDLHLSVERRKESAGTGLATTAATMGTRTHSTRRDARGSSILEALATMVVIGIAVGGFAVNSVSLTRLNKTAGSATAATALAQQKLEELRSMPLGAAALATGVYDDPANPMRPDGSTGGVFSRRWTVSPSDTPRSGLQ